MDQPEIILFRSPSKDQILYVWGLSETLPWDRKWRELEQAFSKFGILHSVHVPERPVAYAFVQYYSPRAALRALNETDGKLIIGSSLLKVSFSTKTPHQWPLHISKCHLLANRYLSYNGWNVKIASEECSANNYHCVVLLEVKKQALKVEGKGFSVVTTGREMGNAKKMAFHRACENAFSKLALVLLPQERNFAVEILNNQQD